MMIESAFRLLRGEGDAQERAEVPSAHRVTDGQRVRHSSLRFLINEEALAIFQELPDLSVQPFSIAEHSMAEHSLRTLFALVRRQNRFGTSKRL